MIEKKDAGVAARIAAGGFAAPLVSLLQNRGQAKAHVSATDVFCFQLPDSSSEDAVAARGVVASLAAVLRRPEGVESAAKALAALVRYCPAARGAIGAEALPALCKAPHDEAAAPHAADAIGSVLLTAALGSNDAAQPLARAVAAADAIRPLVRLLRGDIETNRGFLGMTNAAKTLSELASINPAISDAAADAGPIEPLIDVLRHPKLTVSFMAVYTLPGLIQSQKAQAAAIHAGAIPALITMFAATAELRGTERLCRRLMHCRSRWHSSLRILVATTQLLTQP